MGRESATWGFFFDSCCPFATPLSQKKYVDSLHASLSASRYFASGWSDREKKRVQKKPPCLPSTLMFKQALMQSLLALQCFCSLSAYFRLALPGWLYRLFFLLFPPSYSSSNKGFRPLQVGRMNYPRASSWSKI